MRVSFAAPCDSGRFCCWRRRREIRGAAAHSETPPRVRSVGLLLAGIGGQGYGKRKMYAGDSEENWSMLDRGRERQSNNNKKPN